MNYVPHTEKDKREMLELIGVSSTEELFSDIPASLRLNQELQISGGLSEIELRRLLKNMAAKISAWMIISVLGRVLMTITFPALLINCS